LEYIKIGKGEGARCAIAANKLISGDLENGYYVKPTVFVAHKMRIFQEEIFGPVLSVTKFKVP